MTFTRAAGRAFGPILAAALLAGCGGSMAQPSGGAGPVQASAARGASTTGLLYLTDVKSNSVLVYNYPGGGLLHKLTGFGQPRSECADGLGNVWIVDQGGDDVIEYPYGATKPLVALNTPGTPNGCATNFEGNTLAVTVGLQGVVLSVYHRSSRGVWRDPIHYTDSAMSAGAFAGYDGSGNLFVDGISKTGHAFMLAELPHEGKALQNISVGQTIAAPGAVQWDGTYLAIGDAGVSPSVVYQFSVSGSSAVERGTTPLNGSTSVRQFWIQNGQLIGPDYDKDVGYWNYPAGGSPTQTLKVKGYGAAVAPVPSR